MILGYVNKILVIESGFNKWKGKEKGKEEEIFTERIPDRV